VQQLAARSKALIDEFTGGDEGIRSSLAKMHSSEPSLSSRWGVDPDLWAYMGKASEALERKTLED